MVKRCVLLEYDTTEILHALGLQGPAIIEVSGSTVRIKMVDGTAEKLVDEIVNGPKETLAKGPVKGMTAAEQKFKGE